MSARVPRPQHPRSGGDWARAGRRRRRPYIAIALAGVAWGACTPPPNATISTPTPTGRIVPIDSVTEAYTVSGVQVIQRETFANDVVAANLYLLGGVQEATELTVGIEPLALRAAEYGTTHYPDTVSRFALAATGSSIVVDPEHDWTMIGFRGLVDDFDSTWSVFADRIAHPTLDTAAISLVRLQMLREAEAASESPDGALAAVADSLAFPEHPYGWRPAGSTRSLSALRPEAVRRFVADQFVTSRMLVVIVGHVPRATVERAVARTLGQLPRGNYMWHPPQRPVDHSTSLTVVARPLSTNYLLGYFHGPSITGADYPAFVIATQLLSARLMQSIRYSRGLSYAPYADADTAALVTGSVHVSTDAPDQVIPLIREQIQRCREQWPTQVLVNRVAEHYITVFLMQNETNEAQAASLAQAQIYHGDWHLASATMEALRHVTSADVIRASQRYMHDIQFAYLGNVERVKGVRVTGM